MSHLVGVTRRGERLAADVLLAGERSRFALCPQAEHLVVVVVVSVIQHKKIDTVESTVKANNEGIFRYVVLAKNGRVAVALSLSVH